MLQTSVASPHLIKGKTQSSDKKWWPVKMIGIMAALQKMVYLLV